MSANEFVGATVLICAMDETTSLKKTVDYVVDFCDTDLVDSFLIVLSRKSTPQCVNASQELQEKYGKKLVRIMFQTRPQIGGAMRDGLDAIESTHTLILSSDMPLTLDCVPEMLKSAKKEPDVIFKMSRWIEGGGFEGYDKNKLFFNKLAQRFLRILYCSKLTDLTIPCQIAPTEMYHKIKWESIGFPIHIEFILKPLRLGYEFREFPSRCLPRTEGESKNSFFQTANYLGVALKVRLTKKNRLINK